MLCSAWIDLELYVLLSKPHQVANYLFPFPEFNDHVLVFILVLNTMSCTLHM